MQWLQTVHSNNQLAVRCVSEACLPTLVMVSEIITIIMFSNDDVLTDLIAKGLLLVCVHKSSSLPLNRILIFLLAVASEYVLKHVSTESGCFRPKQL